ncbi:bifunctional 2-dehydro-3-deoxy-phosphogluconate/2-dehydro-3-deoxy-6-phosphogalactonate aldolase [Sulfolobus tengchongensis]|uniref:2-dehydro-3-deoxy-phosphogluconate/2-dehydro-3-deoxy-6-phosphogalactonate aldolase n=1 Tax=Sulfolobus tengchongensis TaxID=207809 RepID=A0AAX4KYV9_9CREN
MAEIITPIITPFTKDNRIDKEKLKIHAENLIKKGIDKIFVNGTTGLGPSLSPEEKLENLKVVYDITNRIIFQVGGLNLEESIKLAKLSKDYDIVGIASYAPYYYPRMPEKHLVKYFKTLCEISPHPVYLYNYPSATGKDIDAKIAKEIGCLVGVKDTIENIIHTLDYKRLNPNMKVYSGSDMLITTVISTGLDGSVAAGSNYLPEVTVAIKKLAMEKRIDEALKLQFLHDEVIEASRIFGSLSSNYVLTKYFQGYDLGYPRPPIFPLDSEEEKQLISKVEGIKAKLIELKILKQ